SLVCRDQARAHFLCHSLLTELHGRTCQLRQAISFGLFAQLDRPRSVFVSDENLFTAERGFDEIVNNHLTGPVVIVNSQGILPKPKIGVLHKPSEHRIERLQIETETERNGPVRHFDIGDVESNLSWAVTEEIRNLLESPVLEQQAVDVAGLISQNDQVV